MLYDSIYMMRLFALLLYDVIHIFSPLKITIVRVRYNISIHRRYYRSFDDRLSIIIDE